MQHTDPPTTIEPMKPPPPGELDVYGEGILKRMLLLDLLEQELLDFGQHPELDHLQQHDLLLGFFYREFLEPKVNDDSQSPLLRLFLALPKIIAVQVKATKAYNTTPYVLMILFDMLIRTKKEKQYAAQVSQEQRFQDFLNENISVRKGDTKDATDARIYSSLISGREKLVQGLLGIFGRIDKDPRGPSEGIKAILNDVKTIKDWPDLPIETRTIFDALTMAFLPMVSEDMKDADKMNQMKKFHHYFPHRSVHALLSVTNPFKVAASMTSLFLVKAPFSTHNLTQKLLEILTNISKTENLIKMKRKELNDADLSKRIEANIRAHYEPTGAAFDTIDDHVEKGKFEDLTPDELTDVHNEVEQMFKEIGETQQITSQRMFIAYQLIALERRRKDKSIFIELLGEPELVEIIKELFPMFCAPLGDIYAKAEFPTWFDQCFKWIKSVYTVADEKTSHEAKTSHLAVELSKYYQAHYDLIRNIVNADSGVLERFFVWMYTKFRVGDGIELDVGQLFDMIPIESKLDVTNELKTLKNYYKIRDDLWKEDFAKAQKMPVPAHPMIHQHMLKPFREYLQTILPRGQSAPIPAITSTLI
eukprot:TRINITY_DN3469_c0_g1_i1.p1 TRINITY_DN3469_c0_g1~~TRINITY_DN3469_c0_g1_i1.p1  ORF type:complete len:590 (-),score=160.06 TRINITY_DN3469_c0_g1_i1:4-1773(-)